MKIVNAIGGCWGVVAVIFGGMSWDTYRRMVEMEYLDIPAWRSTLAFFVGGTLLAIAVAVVCSMSRGRISGLALVIGGVSLAAATVLALLSLGACGHGCSEVKAGPALASLAAIFVFPPIALFSIFEGVTRARGRRVVDD